jgi:hypothetical protein
MVANTLIEIYTLIFAWNLYVAIWDVLAGTGIVLVPFIFALINNFKDNYEEGDALSAIKGVELSLVGMVLVLMLCVIPYKGWEVSLATLKYDLEAPDCHPPLNTEGSGNNTSTAYDDSFSGMGGIGVYKPVAWALVEFISTAITHTAIKSMSCVNNYEFMLMRISEVSIQSPELRKRVRDFYETCYKVALKRFEENPLALPANISEVEDIDWIGSRIFQNTLNEFYQHPSAYVRNMDMYGFTRQAAIRPSDAANETGANPTCKEVWAGEEGPGVVNTALGLRQLILNDIPQDQAGDILDDWMDWGSQVLTVGVADGATKEDLIIKMILQADAANLSSQTEVDLSNNFDTEKAWYKAAADSFFAGAGMLTSVDQFLQSHTMRQLVKVAGPMLLALIQMVVIMAAPFVMVLGHYRLSAFTSVALAYFTFEFINAIWAASFWFDNHILDIYMSQAGWLDIATNGFLVSAVSAGAIILLPGVWMAIMAYAGSGMVRGMGMGGIGGGQAAGANSFNGATRRMGGAAYGRMNSGGGKGGAK